MSRQDRPGETTVAAQSAETLAALAGGLNGPGAEALGGLSEREILDAWERTVAAFLDPGSPERREIQEGLVRNTRLSPAGLEAGLEAVLGGVRGEPAARLFAEAGALRADSGRGSSEAVPLVPAADVVAKPAGVLRDGSSRAGPPGFALVVLSSNLPALAVQPLLPALAARRPVLLKSPSAEPLFAPVFLRALAQRLPALEPAVAAVTWRGGDEALEAPLLARAGVVLAYGDEETVADLERRTAGAGRARFVAYGPKTSLAVIGRDAAADASRSLRGLAPEAVAGIARDVALFDQRGCLSIAAIYLESDKAAARDLADALASELGRLARELPPGPAEPAAAAAVQQLRAEADLRRLHRPRLRLGSLLGVPAGAPQQAPGAPSSRTPAVDTGGSASLAAGTVVVDPDPAFHPTPGLRTVRIHPLPSLGRLPEVLAPWRGRLQGAALAGSAAVALAPALTALGVSRIAPPGDLQRPDAIWHNGGISPLEALVLRQPLQENR